MQRWKLQPQVSLPISSACLLSSSRLKRSISVRYEESIDREDAIASACNRVVSYSTRALSASSIADLLPFSAASTFSSRALMVDRSCSVSRSTESRSDMTRLYSDIAPFLSSRSLAMSRASFVRPASAAASCNSSRLLTTDNDLSSSTSEAFSVWNTHHLMICKMQQNNDYLCQGCYVSLLSVCLSVNRITQNLLLKSLWNFMVWWTQIRDKLLDFEWSWPNVQTQRVSTKFKCSLFISLNISEYDYGCRTDSFGGIRHIDFTRLYSLKMQFRTISSNIAKLHF